MMGAERSGWDEDVQAVAASDFLWPLVSDAQPPTFASARYSVQYLTKCVVLATPTRCCQRHCPAPATRLLAFPTERREVVLAVPCCEDHLASSREEATEYVTLAWMEYTAHERALRDERPLL